MHVKFIFRARIVLVAFLMELGEAISSSLAVIKLTQLHLEQEKAIRAFLSGKDVFIFLPTGYGKSIIYLLLPLIFDRMRGTKLIFIFIQSIKGSYCMLSNFQVTLEVL